MRVEQLLTEMFDRVGNWVWRSDSGNQWVAEFRVNDSTYEFTFDYIEREYYWTANFYPKGGSTIDVTEKHEAIMVLSTAVAILNEFTLKAEQDFGGPYSIEFVASNDGVNRVNVYERILDRKLSNDYEYRKVRFHGNTAMFFITMKD